MKTKIKALLFYTLPVWGVFLLFSCIKDELPYKEADMENFNLNDSIFIIGLEAQDSLIKIIVSDTSRLRKSRFTPTFTISPGAVSVPASGTEVEFDEYTTRYMVTSEDGSLIRKYVARLFMVEPIESSFEDWTTAGIYRYPVLKDNLWSTANSGVSIATSGKIDGYPTTPTEDSHSGQYAAKMETKKGGTYWNKKIPIFSGSLFRGKFSLNTSNFIKSPKFGRIHTKEMGRPVRFEGYYKYKPGLVYTDENGNEVSGKIDECSIHSILYKIDRGDDSNESYLDGENILTSERIIGRAILEDRSAKDSYTFFSINYDYSENFDFNKYDYRLAIVFSSSRDGEQYKGAVGSTLIVDDVAVICRAHE